MVKQNHGSLINTSSGQGRQGFIYTPALCRQQNGRDRHHPEPGPRAGAVEYHRQRLLSGHYRERDVGTTTIASGAKILSTEQKRYGKGELMAEWVEGIPMKRAGKPEDVAGLVAFLASMMRGYLTGQTINIDGGLIMS